MSRERLEDVLAGIRFVIEPRDVDPIKWLFREQPVSDIGIDALVEVVSKGAPTGDWIALQIKSGEAYFRERKAGGIIFRGDSERPRSGLH